MKSTIKAVISAGQMFFETVHETTDIELSALQSS